MFKLHPNALLQKLSLLPNINSVEFIPYYKNECSEYDITKNDCLIKFNHIILQSKLNIPYKIINKQKIREFASDSNNQKEEVVDVCLFPDGKLYYQNFNDKGILKYIQTSNDIFTKKITFSIPDDINLYSQETIEWFKNNG